jgi:hypothetical protein
MTNNDGRKPEGAPERSPKADVGPPSGIDGAFTRLRGFFARRTTN